MREGGRGGRLLRRASARVSHDGVSSASSPISDDARERCESARCSNRGSVDGGSPTWLRAGPPGGQAFGAQSGEEDGNAYARGVGSSGDGCAGEKSSGEKSDGVASGGDQRRGDFVATSGVERAGLGAKGAGAVCE